MVGINDDHEHDDDDDIQLGFGRGEAGQPVVLGILDAGDGRAVVLGGCVVRVATAAGFNVGDVDNGCRGAATGRCYLCQGT